MSGSYYALDTKYNSLLALVKDLREEIIAINQGLGDVLAISDDGLNQNMTNLNNVTVSNLNYTTLTPAVPAIIGTLTQVLTSGNDGGTLDIVNVDEFACTFGGTGVTYPDGLTQTVAYQGAAPSESLGTTMLVGNVASTNLDMSTFEINNGFAAADLTIDSNQDLKLTALTDVDIQSGASIWSLSDGVGITFPDSSVQTTAYTGAGATE